MLVDQGQADQGLFPYPLPGAVHVKPDDQSSTSLTTRFVAGPDATRES